MMIKVVRTSSEETEPLPIGPLACCLHRVKQTRGTYASAFCIQDAAQNLGGCQFIKLKPGDSPLLRTSFAARECVRSSPPTHPPLRRTSFADPRPAKGGAWASASSLTQTCSTEAQRRGFDGRAPEAAPDSRTRREPVAKDSVVPARLTLGPPASARGRRGCRGPWQPGQARRHLEATSHAKLDSALGPRGPGSPNFRQIRQAVQGLRLFKVPRPTRPKTLRP